MNDLNQIIDNNSKAGAADAQAQRNAGKFVVLHYAGLSYLGHSVFDTQDEAEDHASEKGVGLPSSERLVIQPPFAPAAYIPSGDAPATLASLAQAHADRVARNEAEAKTRANTVTTSTLAETPAAPVAANPKARRAS